MPSAPNKKAIESPSTSDICPNPCVHYPKAYRYLSDQNSPLLTFISGWREIGQAPVPRLEVHFEHRKPLGHLYKIRQRVQSEAPPVSRGGPPNAKCGSRRLPVTTSPTKGTGAPNKKTHPYTASNRLTVYNTLAGTINNRYPSARNVWNEDISTPATSSLHGSKILTGCSQCPTTAPVKGPCCEFA